MLSNIIKLLSYQIGFFHYTVYKSILNKLSLIIVVSDVEECVDSVILMSPSSVVFGGDQADQFLFIIIFL